MYIMIFVVRGASEHLTEREGGIKVMTCPTHDKYSITVQYRAKSEPRLREFFRQVEADVVGNIRNKILATCSPV